VAGELRAVLTSIQNSADVDRMGALGSARRQDHASSPPDHVQPEDVDRYIAEMGEVAVVLGLPPKSADVSRSREGGEHQRIQDHARDGLHRQFLTLLMDPRVEALGHGRRMRHVAVSLRVVRRPRR
jgi:phosphate transport system protein